MPFSKITKGKDKGKFKSPSGRVMTGSQVRAYYARQNEKGSGGKTPKGRRKGG